MILSQGTMVGFRLVLTISLVLVFLSAILGLFTGERSTVLLAMTLLGWMGASTSAAVLSTRRVRCPRCRVRWIPAKMVSTKGPCRYCPD